jgi:hypothetical protein
MAPQRPADYAAWRGVTLQGFIGHGIFDGRGREVGTAWRIDPAWHAEGKWSVVCTGGRDGQRYGASNWGTEVERINGAAFEVIARKASAAYKRNRRKWVDTGDGSTVCDA